MNVNVVSTASRSSGREFLARVFYWPFKRQAHKMVKHTQTIRRQKLRLLELSLTLTWDWQSYIVSDIKSSSNIISLDSLIRKNVFACLLSVHITISLSRHEQVCLIRRILLFSCRSFGRTLLWWQQRENRKWLV